MSSNTNAYTIECLAMSAIRLSNDVGHRIVVTHGNGPQIGLPALEWQGAARKKGPLDLLGAETEGAIGYMIQQALRGVLS